MKGKEQVAAANRRTRYAEEALQRMQKERDELRIELGVARRAAADVISLRQRLQTVEEERDAAVSDELRAVTHRLATALSDYQALRDLVDKLARDYDRMFGQTIKALRLPGEEDYQQALERAVSLMKEQDVGINLDDKYLEGLNPRTQHLIQGARKRKRIVVGTRGKTRLQQVADILDRRQQGAEGS